MRLAPLAVAAALLAACAPGGGPTRVLTVEGAPVPAGGVSTVEQALAEAGVKVPAGRLLAIRSGRPLGPDLRPGRVLVDGLPTPVAATVTPGAVITVEGGGDAVEPTEAVTLPVLPNNGWANLRTGARPGLVRVVRGTVSHEVVRRTQVREAYDGTLLSPRPVALTFDDGPDPRWTPAVLQMLARAHVHATFCVVGREVVKHPNLVKAIAAGGHRLCNHTYDHDEHLAQRTPAQILSQMQRTTDAIKKATGGVAPTFFRAPGGSWSPQVDLLARRLHLSPLHWNVDPADWKRPGTGAIVHRVLGSVRPGAIVLLHDGGGRREQTVSALRYFLSRLPARHYVIWVPRPA